MISSLDTNILLRYIWKDVPTQREKAIALLDDDSQTFVINDLVIAELVFNLQADHLPRHSIVNILVTIFSKSNIRVNPLIITTILPFFAEHPALSFVDCYAAFSAEDTNTEPLWTFDKKLANQHPSAKRP